MCDHIDAHIAVKGRIHFEGTNLVNRRVKKRTTKNITPFWSCISKFNHIFIDNAADLDIVVPMYNLLEHRDISSITSKSLWSYYRDEVNDPANEIVTNRRFNNKETAKGEYFKYKTKMIGKTTANTCALKNKVLV